MFNNQLKLIKIVGFLIIKIAGGTTPGKTYLSSRPDGFVDLDGQDNGSGRQWWQFIQVLGNTYNIRVWSGTNPGEYLRSTAPGKVHLYNRDDGSGRQQWVLHHLGNSIYNIKIAGGTNPGKTYLGVTRDGTEVKLYSDDDNSGRQKWIIDPPPPVKSE